MTPTTLTPEPIWRGASRDQWGREMWFARRTNGKIRRIGWLCAHNMLNAGTAVEVPRPYVGKARASARTEKVYEQIARGWL